ncbi:MAG: very short patch repair endonuclease [Isosphaeraceae bacterium]
MADNLTPEQRRKAMQAVKGRNTSLERRVSSALHRRGWRFRRNVSTLPGKPDFVFLGPRVVVFVDGDFWHGWRFPRWKSTLPVFWQEKIERNRRRDQRNFRGLRRMGWKVLRVWEHQVADDLERVLDQVGILIGRPGESSSKPAGIPHPGRSDSGSVGNS